MKSKIKKLIHLFLCFSVFSVAACHAQTLVTYNFNNQDSQAATLTASTLATNLSAGFFSVSDGTFTSINSTTGGPPDSPSILETGSWNAITPTKYFAFTITPAPGFSTTVTNISFDYRQTTSGAANYQIDIGSNANLASGTFTRDSSWLTVDKSISLTAFTTAQEIRIYGYNGGTGNFSIDRVTLSGSVSAIPEPSTYAAIFGSLALAGTVWHRRRQRKAV